MKFEIRFYRLESDIMKEYKTVTVNQDILVTSLIQIEAKNLCPFNVDLNVKEFTLYLYFTNDENHVSEELKTLAKWLNEKRWEQ